VCVFRYRECTYVCRRILTINSNFSPYSSPLTDWSFNGNTLCSLLHYSFYIMKFNLCLQRLKFLEMVKRGNVTAVRIHSPCKPAIQHRFVLCPHKYDGAIYPTCLLPYITGSVGSNPTRGINLYLRPYCLCCPVWVDALGRACPNSCIKLHSDQGRSRAALDCSGIETDTPAECVYKPPRYVTFIIEVKRGPVIGNG